MKALILFVMLVALVVLGLLSDTLGLSKATAVALWVAASLFVAKPLLIQGADPPVNGVLYFRNTAVTVCKYVLYCGTGTHPVL